MAVERHDVGRKYTKRRRIYVSPDSLGTPEGVAALLESFQEMAKSATLEDRLAKTLQWAEATVERAGVAPEFSSPAWRRQNEFKSIAWYAIEILETWNQLRAVRERGDDLALNLAANLGVLATEARFIERLTSKQRQGGKAPRAEKNRLHEKWRRQAAEIWTRKPKLSERAVAVAIDPAHWETIRPVIRDLNPNRRKRKNIG